MIVKERHINMKATKLFTLLALLMVFAVSCTKPDEPNNGGNTNGPNDSIVDPNGGGNNGNNDNDVRVTTYTPQDITGMTAKCGGDVIVTQGLSLSELGICWSKEMNPTANHNCLSTTIWNEPFVCTITGLIPNTKYYVRAYVLRGLEYYYGEEMSFVTDSNGGGSLHNGHDFVDLGLPSGLLWATCNVGATSPEDYGDYFAWGEIEPKNYYNWYNYKWRVNEGAGQEFNFNFIKYCNAPECGYNGFTDNLTELLPTDDAAAVNWGGDWRMPTMTEWEELFQNTTHVWKTQNGVRGYLFTTGKGSSLFLPAAGSCCFNEFYEVGECGKYWSNSIDVYAPEIACLFCFDSSYKFGGSSRISGCSVRPVCSRK